MECGLQPFLLVLVSKTFSYKSLVAYSISLTIKVVNCGPLTNPDNGLVDTFVGTIFGSTATYTCDTGYTLSGSQSRNCGADGNWTSSEPFCQGKYLRN